MAQSCDGGDGGCDSIASLLPIKTSSTRKFFGMGKKSKPPQLKYPAVRKQSVHEKVYKLPTSSNSAADRDSGASDYDKGDDGMRPLTTEILGAGAGAVAGADGVQDSVLTPQQNYEVRLSSARDISRELLCERVFFILDLDGDGMISMSDIQRCLGWVGAYLDIDTLKEIFQNQSNLTYEEFFRSVEWEEEDKKVDDWLEDIEKYGKKIRSLDEEYSKRLWGKYFPFRKCEKIRPLEEIFPFGKYEKVDGLHEESRNYSEKDDVGRGITAKGLKKKLSDLGVERKTKECVKMIRNFYPNGDGVINLEEFKVLWFFFTFPLNAISKNKTLQGKDRKIDKD